MATFISKKVEQGESKRRIASRLGIDPAAVTHLLALVRDPPPFLMELYHARRCRSPWLLYRLRLLWDVDPVLTEAGCVEAGEINGALVDALDGMRAERGGAPGREASDNSELTSPRPNDAGAAPAPEQLLSGAAHEEPVPRGRRHKAGASMRKARSACPWPQLFGTVEGREVVVLPELLASSEGTVIVRFLGTDTTELEVALDTIRLTKIVRS
jgi:ParB family chromosome partitioning protein